MTRLRLLCLLLPFTPLRAAVAPSTPWRAGVAVENITPAAPLWMAGYASRTKPADGKETELFAKALALEDAGGTRLVIVTLDLIGVPQALRLNVEKRVADAHRLPREGLLLNASHTHSGPEFRLGRSPGEERDPRIAAASRAYGRELEEKIFATISGALAQLAPARLGYTHARAGFAMNRRLPTAKGYTNSANPAGPVDQAVPVLRVTDATGKLRAVVFGYACHNTTLALQQWNADYAGYAQTYIEAAHPGAVAMFVTGAAGDQNPYPRGKVELAQQHGRALANGVETALGVAPREVRGPLRAAYANVALDYAPLPTRAEWQTRLASKDRTEADHAKRFLAKLDAGETLPTTYPCPIQVVRFGDDLLLAAIGGEVCVDYSLRLKRELAGPAAVWIAGYSNDVMGYIPSQRVREEGGYEGETAMRYSYTHPGPWAASLEERIITQVHTLNRSLQTAVP